MHFFNIIGLPTYNVLCMVVWNIFNRSGASKTLYRKIVWSIKILYHKWVSCSLIFTENPCFFITLLLLKIFEKLSFLCKTIFLNNNVYLKVVKHVIFIFQRVTLMDVVFLHLWFIVAVPNLSRCTKIVFSYLKFTEHNSILYQYKSLSKILLFITFLKWYVN